MEFAVPHERALEILTTIRTALKSQPILVYFLRFGPATDFEEGMTYKQVCVGMV